MYCGPLYIFSEMVYLLLHNGPFGRINPIFMLLHLFVAFHTDIMTQIRGLMMVMVKIGKLSSELIISAQADLDRWVTKDSRLPHTLEFVRYPTSMESVFG